MRIRLGLVFTAGFDLTFEAYHKREQVYLFSFMVFWNAGKFIKALAKRAICSRLAMFHGGEVRPFLLWRPAQFRQCGLECSGR